MFVTYEQPGHRRAGTARLRVQKMDKYVSNPQQFFINKVGNPFGGADGELYPQDRNAHFRLHIFPHFGRFMNKLSSLYWTGRAGEGSRGARRFLEKPRRSLC